MATGSVTIDNSTLTDNETSHRGGSIYTLGALTITNSSTYHQGGGIYNEGTLTVNNSTFSGNTAADQGSGSIYNYSGASLYLHNSIFANSDTLNYDCYALSDSAVVSVTNTLIERNRACGTPLFTDDPLLADLDDYGGDTLTFALLPSSPAIDAGDSATCNGDDVGSVDQRGASRPAGVGCDLGAFEAQFALTPTGGDGQSTPAGATFGEALAVAVTGTHGAPVGAGAVITFTGEGLTAIYTGTVDTSETASATVTANLLVGSYVVTTTGTSVITPATFTLTNTNTAPVVPAATFNVRETASVGTVVGNVTTSDPNDHGLSFSITGGNVGDAFAIGSTGQLTVAGALDYDVTPQYLLTVGVSDGYITSTAAITVNVSNCGTVVVTNADDSGAGSLRQAVADACLGDTITFADAFTILLDSAIALDQALTIDGAGQSVVLNGQDTTRIFTVGSSGVVTRRRYLQHGRAGLGRQHLERQ